MLMVCVLMLTLCPDVDYLCQYWVSTRVQDKHRQYRQQQERHHQHRRRHSTSLHCMQRVNTTVNISKDSQHEHTRPTEIHSQYRHHQHGHAINIGTASQLKLRQTTLTQSTSRKSQITDSKESHYKHSSSWHRQQATSAQRANINSDIRHQRKLSIPTNSQHRE